jgi:hypothetical protein
MGKLKIQKSYPIHQLHPMHSKFITEERVIEGSIDLNSDSIYIHMNQRVRRHVFLQIFV